MKIWKLTMETSASGRVYGPWFFDQRSLATESIRLSYCTTPDLTIKEYPNGLVVVATEKGYIATLRLELLMDGVPYDRVIHL